MADMLFTVVVWTFGGLAWITGALVAIGRVRARSRGVVTTGHVVDVTTHRASGYRDEGRPTRALVIEFTDRATGKPIQFTSSFATSRTSTKPGQRVPVRYIPGEEYTAEIDRFWNQWGYPILAWLVGSVLLGAWWYARHHPA